MKLKDQLFKDKFPIEAKQKLLDEGIEFFVNAKDEVVCTSGNYSLTCAYLSDYWMEKNYECADETEGYSPEDWSKDETFLKRFMERNINSIEVLSCL